MALGSPSRLHEHQRCCQHHHYSQCEFQSGDRSLLRGFFRVADRQNAKLIGSVHLLETLASLEEKTAPKCTSLVDLSFATLATAFKRIHLKHVKIRFSGTRHN